MRNLIGVLIFSFGVGTVSLSTGVVLWWLDKAELINLDKLKAYPNYQL